MKLSTFNENVIIITGASFGIGRQLALLLADLGASLVLAGRNVEKLEEVSKKCSQQGSRKPAGGLSSDPRHPPGLCRDIRPKQNHALRVSLRF